MTQLTYWKCLANVDSNEGRGPMRTVCYAATKEAALKIVNNPLFYTKYGVQGCKPYKNGEHDISEETIAVYSDLDDYLKTVHKIERETALAKLTEAEKIALGLTDKYKNESEKLSS